MAIIGQDHMYLLTLNLLGEFNVRLLDNRHVVIHLSLEEDYIRLYSRMVWYIGKVTMHVFHWTSHFRVDKESPLMRVWINLPRLPIILFHQSVLFSIARLVRHPLRSDETIASMSLFFPRGLVVETTWLCSHIVVLMKVHFLIQKLVS